MSPEPPPGRDSLLAPRKNGIRRRCLCAGAPLCDRPFSFLARRARWGQPGPTWRPAWKVSRRFGGDTPTGCPLAPHRNRPLSALLLREGGWMGENGGWGRRRLGEGSGEPLFGASQGLFLFFLFLFPFSFVSRPVCANFWPPAIGRPSPPIWPPRDLLGFAPRGPLNHA